MENHHTFDYRDLDHASTTDQNRKLSAFCAASGPHGGNGAVPCHIAMPMPTSSRGKLAEKRQAVLKPSEAVQVMWAGLGRVEGAGPVMARKRWKRCLTARKNIHERDVS